MGYITPPKKDLWPLYRLAPAVMSTIVGRSISAAELPFATLTGGQPILKKH